MRATLGKLIHPLLAMIACATDPELRRYVEYLKAENRILRSRLPKKIDTTKTERATLVKLGMPLGSKVKELVGIVSPRTFLRWVQDEREDGQKVMKQPNNEPKEETKGNRIPDEVRELIIHMAKTEGWGAGRIKGELYNLGFEIGRTTVNRILRENNFPVNPPPRNGTWSEFIRSHGETLWACDFFSKKVLTFRGWVDYYVLFFIQVGTRKIHIAGMTTNPDELWMKQQARNLILFFDDLDVFPRYIIHDADTKFTKSWREILECEDIKPIRIGPRRPDMNAIAERWIKSIKEECLSLFLVFGENHLRHLIREYVDYYHTRRPHRSLDYLPPCRQRTPELVESIGIGDVVRRQSLGGVLSWYERRAA